MRTKDEILKDVREDITNDTYKRTADKWIQYRLIEVLLDIRDILNLKLPQLTTELHNLAIQD